MLVELDDIKNYLEIPLVDTTYDSFLTDQEEVISQSVESYCGRNFLQSNYVQTYYPDDYTPGTTSISTFNYPLVLIESIVLGGADITGDVRVHKNSGMLIYKEGFFQESLSDDELVVTYCAGLDELPAPVKSVILSLVEERYNKNLNGISLNFGNDVQSISIPGTISVSFDYSLQSNDRKTAFGTILGNYVNVLDNYRSERALIGSGTLNYVD